VGNEVAGSGIDRSFQNQFIFWIPQLRTPEEMDFLCSGHAAHHVQDGVHIALAQGNHAFARQHILVLHE
jgi:hypothetical protein